MKPIINLIRRYAPFRAIFDYRNAPKESLSVCPGCGASVAEQTEAFCSWDRYGYGTETRWCCQCDMLFVNPRLTPAAYAAFYDEGIYRRLIKAFSGKSNEHELPQERVLRLGQLLQETLKDRPVSTLNIGGTRADYDVLSRVLTLRDYLCLNPGGDDAGDGYRVEKTTLEEFDGKGQTYDLICLFGTLNHLLLPLLSFQKIASLLAPGGIFVFDFKDPLAKMERVAHPSGALQFDHAVYPTHQTLYHMLDRVGLACLSRTTDNGRVFFYSVSGRGSIVEPVASPGSEKARIQEFQAKAKRLPLGLVRRAVTSFIRSCL